MTAETDTILFRYLTRLACNRDRLMRKARDWTVVQRPDIARICVQHAREENRALVRMLRRLKP